MIVEYKHLKRPRFIVEFDQQKIFPVIWKNGVNEYGDTSGWLHSLKDWMRTNGFGEGVTWVKQYDKTKHSWLISHVSSRRGAYRGSYTPFGFYFDDLNLAKKFDQLFGSNNWLSLWLANNINHKRYKYH